MKTIEWTRTGGRTHRVTITTDEPISATNPWPSLGVCQRLNPGTCSPCMCDPECTHDLGFNPTIEWLAINR